MLARQSLHEPVRGRAQARLGFSRTALESVSGDASLGGAVQAPTSFADGPSVLSMLGPMIYSRTLSLPF